MNDRITLGAASIMGVLTLGTAAVLWAVTPVREPGRHRGGFVSLDDLMGQYTEYTHDFEHAPGVVRQAFDECPRCDRTTAGVRTDDGWWCGECLQPAGAEAVS